MQVCIVKTYKIKILFKRLVSWQFSTRFYRFNQSCNKWEIQLLTVRGPNILKFCQYIS
uniref:Uncharacterized protein n=1 Tax=Glossina morsitans morsitans TaxID=37546 RepID=A0A1B0G1Z8_GLOMM